jgi:hypothetical protein
MGGNIKMPTKEDWWSKLPSGYRQRFWERRYLDDIGKINPANESIVDAIGLLNMRWRPDIMGIFQWNPLEYHTFGYFRTHPCAGAGEINIETYLETGLDFYVYLCMDSLYVNYERVKENDQFILSLPQACGIQESLRMQCKIIEPSDPLRRKHQVVLSWDGGFVALALPVFLRLEPEALGNISTLFEQYGMNTLMFDLRYFYPREQKFTLTDDLSHVIVESLSPDDPMQGTAVLCWPHFFTFGRARDEIRFLVASDIHVAERCDRIQQMGSAWLPEPQGPGRLGADYCNYNKQAKRLAQIGLKKWQQGEIDYVVLAGDLVDFSLKDTIQAQVDIKPTDKFFESPRPYGYGEPAFNLGSAISLPDSRPAFEPEANIQRIEEVLSKLADLTNTNWDLFRTIFRPMLSCVHTFLVPGNHDYLIFGSELAGMEREEFDSFFGEEGAFGVYLTAQSPWKRFGAFISGAQPPGWVDLSTFNDMRLTGNQAREYDKGRSLKCGDNNEFRALLGPFWSYQTLSGLYQLGDDPDLRGADVRTSIISDFPIKLNGKYLRFAFLNSGPVWNQICNPSPWLCGFSNPKKETNVAISEVEKWRNNDAFKDDMLVLFMHAPPLSRRFPSPGIKEYCFNFVLDDIEDISEDEKWPNSEYELTNIWRKPGAAQETELANDPMFGAPFHNHERLIRALSPQEARAITSEGHDLILPPEKKREGPVLILAGHTHWRHTYALKKFVDDQTDNPRFRSRGWLSFDQGNELLIQLNDSHDPGWWKQDGAGRSLIVTTGCVGPYPPGEFKIGGGGRLEYGDESEEGYTNPRDKQGFYIVTVKRSWGRVSKIEWNTLWYLDDI